MRIAIVDNSPVVCDGYVKYKKAEVDRSVIMQDFRHNEKKTIKNGFHFGFYQCKICHELYLWHTCFISIVQLFCIFFELRKYHKITQIQNGR